MIRLKHRRQPSQYAHLLDCQSKLLSALELLTRRPVRWLEDNRTEERNKAGKLIGFSMVSRIAEVRGLREDQSARLAGEVATILRDLLHRDWKVEVTGMAGGWKVEVTG